MLKKLKEAIQQFQSNKHLKEIALGASLAFGIKIVAVIILFLFNMAIARQLGSDLTGKYLIVFAVINLGVIFGKHGFDRTMLRFIAPRAVANNWKQVTEIFNHSFIRVLGYSIFITIAIILCSDLIAVYFLKRPDVGGYIRFLALAIVPLSLSFCLTETYKAIKSVAISVSIRGIAIPFLTIIGILLLAGTYKVEGVIISQIAAAYFVALIAFLYVRHIIKKRKKELIPEVAEEQLNIAELKTSSQSLFWESILQEIVTVAPIFIIGILLTDSAVGKYEMARRIALSTNLFLFAFNTILSPKIGELYMKKELVAMGNIVRKSVILMIGLTLPIFSVLFFFPEQMMSLMGKSFIAGGSTVLKIILIGQFLHIIFGPAGSILLMCGYEKYLKISGYIGIVLIVVLNLILVPWLGLIGGALAFSLTLVLRNIYIAYYVKKHLDLFTIPYLDKIIKKLNLSN